MLTAVVNAATAKTMRGVGELLATTHRPAQCQVCPED